MSVRLNVLFHYSLVDFNVEKLSCAYYMLDNLRYQYHVKANSTLIRQQQELKHRTDSIYAALQEEYGWDKIPFDTILSERKKSELWIQQNFVNGENKEQTEISVSDIITSDFIISQIDAAYDLWKQSKHASSLSLGEFQESILPYSCISGYGQPQNLNQMKSAIPALAKMSEQKSINEMIKYYQAVIRNLRDINGSLGEKSSKGIMSMYSRDEDCLDIAHYGCMILRSFGVPAVVDHVVGFRQLPGRHYFCSVYNAELKKWQGFNPEGSLPGEEDFLGTPTLNIYRDTYAAHKDTPYFLRNKDEYVPNYLNNPCMTDVTKLYMTATSVTIPIETETSNNLAYLAGFCSREKDGLIATTWATIDKKRKRVVFDNVIPDVVYVPIIYSGTEAVSFGQPFYVKIYNGKNKICHLPISSKDTKKIDVVLHRKYPIKPNMQKIAKEMIGSVILGSNDKDFAHADTLLKLASAPTQYLQSYPLTKTGYYKYYRFQAPSAYPHSNIAHFEWLVPPTCSYKYTRHSSRTAILNPSDDKKAPYSTYLSLEDAGPYQMEQMPQYDYNPLTSAGGYPFFNLKLHTPQKVEAVNYMAMHANNTITPEHEYILFYWDGKWKECGHSKALYEYVEFKGIPSDKLYWLYDVSEGQEEIPFLVRNNHQCFIYR